MSAANPDFFDQWKQSANYSDDFKLRQTQHEEDEKYDEAKSKFYACTGIDNEIRDEEKRKFIDDKSVFNLKKQFCLESNESSKPKHHFSDNIDFMTSNNFYNTLTKNSVDTQVANPHESSVINDLDPSVFEVAAKKVNYI